MVWGNLATGYWLGGAAAAGLHWVELGRTTLTGTGDDIKVTDGWRNNSDTYFSVNGTQASFSATNVDDSAGAYDLGTVSDTQWVLRMKVNFSQIGHSSDSAANGGNISFVISSTDETGGSNDSQNELGWAWGEPPATGGTGTGQNYIGIRSGSTSSNAGSSASVSYTHLTLPTSDLV